MKAIAINGSARKRHNTATLLKNVLAGAKSKGADTELVHLYDLDYKGCTGCYTCKKIGGKSYGRCAKRDGITPLLEKVAKADVVVLGSPIYFFTETAQMRAFMERLLFPYLTYTPGNASIFPRKIQTALVYTMNWTEEQYTAVGQDKPLAISHSVTKKILGNCELMLCHETHWRLDYSKHVNIVFDPIARAKRREEVFPQDCARAYELGAKLAATAKTEI